MRKLAIITSSINPREGNFSYSQKRSHFDAETRFQQTVFTVNSLKNCIPDIDIAIIDSSEEYSEYQSLFNFFSNTKFYPMKEISKEVFEIANTHKSKSHCECLLLNTFYNYFKKEIKEYDYVIKTSGRYFHFNFDENVFNEENTDKIFFKRPLEFNWDENWNFNLTDLRSIENHNLLKQYCTVLYAFGAQHLDKFIDVNDACLHLTNYPELSHYDIETLYYYFTRPFKQNIVETKWIVSGWCGVSGRFWYY